MWLHRLSGNVMTFSNTFWSDVTMRHSTLVGKSCRIDRAEAKWLQIAFTLLVVSILSVRLVLH